MKSRIFAGGAVVLVLAGMLFWQVADAQYPGSGGGGPPGPGMMGYGYGMGPGMMGPGMMGGNGYGMGPGMMGPGMMGGNGYGMGPGMMGPGMMGGNGYGMGPGMMGPGMMGYGPGMMGRGLRGQQVNLNVTVPDVKSYLERWIAFSGNPHIKVGDVTEKNVDTITADIVTTDKAALVQRYAIDRHTGLFQPEGD